MARALDPATGLESADSETVVVTVPGDAFPDLAALPEGIVSAPPVPVAGQATQLRVQVVNVGDNDASEAEVLVRVIDPAGGVVLDTRATLPLVPAGDGASLLVPWTPAAPALYTVRVEVDPDGRVAESSEANNAAERAVRVLAEEGLAAEVTSDRSSYPVASTARVTVSTVNAGTPFVGVARTTVEDVGRGRGGAAGRAGGVARVGPVELLGPRLGHRRHASRPLRASSCACAPTGETAAAAVARARVRHRAWRRRPRAGAPGAGDSGGGGAGRVRAPRGEPGRQRSARRSDGPPSRAARGCDGAGHVRDHALSPVAPAGRCLGRHRHLGLRAARGPLRRAVRGREGRRRARVRVRVRHRRARRAGGLRDAGGRARRRARRPGGRGPPRAREPRHGRRVGLSPRRRRRLRARGHRPLLGSGGRGSGGRRVALAHAPDRDGRDPARPPRRPPARRGESRSPSIVPLSSFTASSPRRARTRPQTARGCRPPTRRSSSTTPRARREPR